MTLDQWLLEATGTFPRGVRERLRQEYGAHLQDSVAAGGSGDVVALFGEPSRVTKELTRLYVTSARLKMLGKMSGNWYWFILMISIWQPVYTLTYQASILNICYFIIEMMVFAMIILNTTRWTRERQTIFRHRVIMAAALLFNSSSQTFRDSSNPTLEILFTISVLGIIWSIFETSRDDNRIQRTLHIESTELKTRWDKIRF